MKRKAPTPKGSLLAGHLHPIRNDVLRLLETSTRDHGDIVRFHIGPLVFHLLNHPDHVSHVMIRNRANYDKASRSSEALGLICGESLLTSNGDVWQRQRKMIQPMFHRAAVAGFVSTIARSTEEMLTEWEAKAHRGESIEIASEMMKLTFRIVGRCLFGTDLDKEADAVDEAMHVLITHTYRRWRSLVNPPASWPTPANLRFRKALADVDDIVASLIERHRQSPPAAPNLLSMLIAGCGPDNDREIRNEAITFLLAGHETTANGLSWAGFGLCAHPDWQEKIRSQFLENCGDRSPEMSDLPTLTHALHFFEETVRLHPPIWAMERRVIADDKIGGYGISRNSGVIISPYTLHRHPLFWERPDEFHPERFEKRDHEAFYPFGAGPRFCIGSEFALAEARVILPMILRRFELSAVPGQQVEAEPAITLRIKEGFRIKLHPM
jgi:cytochrome P450